MKKYLFLAIFLTACPSTEPVVINAEDVSYGESGDTVGDTLDRIEKNQGTKLHTHNASAITGFKTAAINAMGVKTNSNPLKHDRYGETDLKASATIKALDTRITVLEGGGTTPTGTACPSGYLQDKTVTKHTVCKKGLDEMVKVGDFWTDRLEAVITKTTCSSTNPAHWITASSTSMTFDNFRACSSSKLGIGGLPPSSLTYYQAQVVCNNAGKHLCTNAEWQQAAYGTDTTKANLNTAQRIKVGTSGSISHWGAYDMVGNVAEWVGGLVVDGTSLQGKGLLRGGSFDDSAGTDTDHIRMFSPMLKNDTKRSVKGARCCISGGR